MHVKCAFRRGAQPDFDSWPRRGHIAGAAVDGGPPNGAKGRLAQETAVWDRLVDGGANYYREQSKSEGELVVVD